MVYTLGMNADIFGISCIDPSVQNFAKSHSVRQYTVVALSPHVELLSLRIADLQRFKEKYPHVLKAMFANQELWSNRLAFLKDQASKTEPWIADGKFIREFEKTNNIDFEDKALKNRLISWELYLLKQLDDPKFKVEYMPSDYIQEKEEPKLLKPLNNAIKWGFTRKL